MDFSILESSSFVLGFFVGTPSVAINWQLNAAPHLCVHKPCPLQREETMPVQCASGQLAISLVTSLVPRLTILLFGMGTRLLVHMRAKSQNGVLLNGQQPQSVVNGFY